MSDLTAIDILINANRIGPHGWRLRAMIVMLWRSGLRATEAPRSEMLNRGPVSHGTGAPREHPDANEPSTAPDPPGRLSRGSSQRAAPAAASTRLHRAQGRT